MDTSAFSVRFLSGAMVLGAMAGLSACGGTPVDDAAEVSTSQGALASSEWINGWGPISFEDGSPMISETPPVACEAQYDVAGGQAFFKTSPAGRVQIAWKSYSPFHAWTTIGNTSLAFSLSPACASLDGAYDSGGTRNKQIAVVARGPSLGRYWIAIWKLGNSGGFGEVPTTGTLIHDWVHVSTDAYAGTPAATVQSGKLMVLGRKSDNSLVMRSYTLKASTSDPFSGGTWTAATTMPALPTGWVPNGEPAISHAPKLYGPAVILVTASKPGTSGTRLYRSTTANGTTFTAWTQIGVGLSATTSFGSPSIEIGYRRDATFRYTAYVLGVNGIVYQSSTNPGTTTFAAFASIPNSGPTFAGGPAAIGGNLGADSAHAVMAKVWGSDQLYFTASTPGVE